MKAAGILALSFLLFAASCKKDEETQHPDSVPVSLNLAFRFEVDGDSLSFDTMKYANAAGNHYRLETLVFYLSQIALQKEDNSWVELKDYLYIDARDASTLHVSLSNIPTGCYSAIRFNIGIDSAHNVPGGLPLTTENLAMEWPVPMGGGYHFLKMEGYFADTSGTPGFAMHLGTNASLVHIVLPVSLCASGNDLARTLTMNVNEWFRNPYNYDFNIDGNYSMGNVAAMGKLTANGADVFSIE